MKPRDSQGLTASELLPFLIMFQNYGGGSIGKLLLLSFKDDDEEILNELFGFLTSKYHMEMICSVPEIGMGNQPIDGGNYLFVKEDNGWVSEKRTSSCKMV